MENHFTWFTSAKYKNIDLFDTYRKFIDKFFECGYDSKTGDPTHWMNNSFTSNDRIKMDLFNRFGYIAAAGDRHLAEFMDGEEYLASPECVREWMFGLTTVEWRKNNLKERLARSERLFSGEEVYEIRDTGEEGTLQMRALLGLDTMVTNINLPNVGQISNLPMGTIVETNATMRLDAINPVCAGAVPDSIYPLVARAARENDYMLEAGFSLDLDYAMSLFCKLNMVKNLTEQQKKDLFTEMCRGTAKYLGDYKFGNVL